MNSIFDKKYNAKRKELLIKCDKKEEVDNLSLSMYGLYNYVKVKNDGYFDDKLIDVIIANNKEQFPIRHIYDKNRFFIEEQQRFLNELFQHDKIILSAPTSFGKTLILKEYIFRAKPNLVVYIVPTNALSYELESFFKKSKMFNTDYIIFDRAKNSTHVDKKMIFIGTQEKYQEVKGIFEDNIDCFVIDEAYKLSEPLSGQRCYILSKSFLSGIKSKQTILLSPNATFIGFTDYGFFICESTFNLVDKVYSVLSIANFSKTLIERCSHGKTILYCDSPNKFSDALAKLPVIYSDYDKDFAEQLEREIHPDWNVIKLFRKGILSHNGVMPKYVQNKMMRMFNSDDNYKLLIGTNSISEGINTPTENIFIHPGCDFHNQWLLLKNTIGRAGRLGQYPIGKIFSTTNFESYINNQEITIKLSASDDAQKTELTDSDDKTKIIKFCKSNSIDETFCKEILEKYQFSLAKLNKILDSFKEDRYYSDVSNSVFIAQKAFGKDYSYADAYNDAFIVRSILNFYYKIGDKKLSFNSMDDRIRYLKLKNDNFKDKDNSYIIDAYMKFNFSTLDYKILPIMKVGKDIIDKYGDWMFGDNVKNTITKFIQRFYSKCYGINNFDDYDENEQKILSALREYGIQINQSVINKEMISEINNQLNLRYSTYDIIQAVKYLSIKSPKNKIKFSNLYEKYFS